MEEKEYLTKEKIFDMIEAVATRRRRKALDYYYDLLALKEPPMRILYLLKIYINIEQN